MHFTNHEACSELAERGGRNHTRATRACTRATRQHAPYAKPIRLDHSWLHICIPPHCMHPCHLVSTTSHAKALNPWRRKGGGWLMCGRGCIALHDVRLPRLSSAPISLQLEAEIGGVTKGLMCSTPLTPFHQGTALNYHLGRSCLVVVSHPPTQSQGPSTHLAPLSLLMAVIMIPEAPEQMARRVGIALGILFAALFGLLMLIIVAIWVFDWRSRNQERRWRAQSTPTPPMSRISRVDGSVPSV